jgi:hypothetical protein
MSLRIWLPVMQINVSHILLSWDNLVINHVMTVLHAVRSVDHNSNYEKDKRFFFSPRSRPALKSSYPPIHGVLEMFYSGVKQLQFKVVH